MAFDPKSAGDHVLVHNPNIAQFSSYNYLGVNMDNVVSWKIEVESVCCRLQRLYFLRRLRVIGVEGNWS